MLAIIAAEITSHQGFNTPSVFLKLLQVRGYRYHSDPLSQFLRRLGVTHVMDRKVIRLPNRVKRNQIDKALLGHPSWVLIQNDGWQILSGDDLISYFQAKTLKGDTFDLSKIPVRRITAAPIPVQATLGGALRKMDQETVNALCVVPHLGERILGVITRADIERSYRLPLN